MPEPKYENRKVISADGVELDATFHVEPFEGKASVVFESSGGGTRNTDYRQGLEVLLERLRNLGASLVDAALASRDTVSLTPDERRLALRGRAYPIVLGAESDIPALRRALSAAQALVGRAPGAISGGGNKNKRIRLVLEFPSSYMLDLDDLEDELAHGGNMETDIGAELPTYLARLCWNSAGWVHPTGEAKTLETNTYATEYSFGHEEWLFNLAWVLDGFHYAYLQPIRPSWARLQGQKIRIRLFTIAPGGERFYVGELQSCEVLTEDQAEEASRGYKKRGWTKEMIQQVLEIEGNPQGLAGDAINRFNIRFRPENATYFAPHRTPATSILKDRYIKYRLGHWNDELTADFKGAAIPLSTRKRQKNGVEKKSTKTIHKSGSGSSSYDPVHNILQEELRDLLIEQYGDDAVSMEENHVDLKVRLPNRNVFIELKTAPNARLALRQALGQLLEYAHFDQFSEATASELVVVAPAIADKDEAAYIELLKSKFKLPLSYRTYQRGMKEFKL
ncbi:hypothetical protein [Myxococcus sp. XM-1-1-1]|uniref:hypothetical protein n=1 Tax=Myxococcus sp. XM-1-1-1 TaxID=2874602 RepID=UPI001CBFB964|nr:hypothetical protein [Myxococcus sp. XM-1-1-1]